MPGRQGKAREAAMPTRRGLHQQARTLQAMTLEERLVHCINVENIKSVEEMLDAGANADGPVGGEIPPIGYAANHGSVDMIELLHKRGANLEAAAPIDSFDEDGDRVFWKGWRPLHGAASASQVASVRALVKAGADPDGTDEEGLTPLMIASYMSMPSASKMPVVQALLECGAVPSRADRQGRMALHFAARKGYTAVMDVLLRTAPSTLNIADSTGRTALAHAAESEQRAAVSYLLSAGATEKAALAQMNRSALLFSIFNGKKDMVRLLLDEGMEAVGGMQAMPRALKTAAASTRGSILQMVLNAHAGADVNAEYWTQRALDYGDVPVLHIAAAFGSLSVIHALLAAGADETVVASDGRRASDVIRPPPGEANDESVRRVRDEAEEAAMGRMLERGPAFRARSWAWPTRTNSRDDETARQPAPSLGVRVFRQGNGRLFTRRFPRYAMK